MEFSKLGRNNILNQSLLSYDIIIIGGGITGAGILLDATNRGLKAILLEKNDFASGTSSKSTKLIHGGLRYLKNLEFGLVREVGLERAVLYNNALHIIHPEKMLLPIVQNGTLGMKSSALALFTYDYLAGVSDKDKKKMLTKKQVVGLEPLINEEILLGGALYTEYRCDDYRIVMEVLKKAVSLGGVAINYAEVIDFIYENTICKGVKIEDRLTNTIKTIHGKIIINATGPWVDDLRVIDKSKNGKQLHLTKGIHIVVNHSKLPIKQSIYFDTKDDRMIFAIPRNGIVYIGTTDTDFDKDKDNINVSVEDKTYLINAIQNVFPGIAIDLSDIVAEWAGLRPLIHEEGKNPSELSRKDEIFIAPSKMVSIAGGKLTGYRKMAEKVVDGSMKKLKKYYQYPFKPCTTKYLKLSGGDFLNEKAFAIYKLHILDIVKQIPYTEKQVLNLVYRYGSNTEQIVTMAYDFVNNGFSPQTALLQAEVTYCKEYEMVHTFEDFWIRRTGNDWFFKNDYEQFIPLIKQWIEA